MSTLIIPSDTQRTIPEWFARGLHEIDPSLILFFNPFRERWIIDRCTAAGVHSTSNHQHTPQCPRTNVRIIQDDNGQYMPLCESVLQWLRAHDTWAQHGCPDTFVHELKNKDDSYQDKLRRDRRDSTHHATMFNRRQLNQMFTLIQRHDLRPNK